MTDPTKSFCGSVVHGSAVLKNHSIYCWSVVGLVGRLVKSVRACALETHDGLLYGRGGSVPGDFSVGRRSFYHKYDFFSNNIIPTSAQTVSWVYRSGRCVYIHHHFYLPLHLLITFKPALGWLFLCIHLILLGPSPFDCLQASLGLGWLLASCSSILWVLFLVFIFVHFYLVKCTFLQNIVNYDVWHTFWSLHVAGWALESCFDVLPVFFHGFGTPTFLPRVFHVLASCSSILWVLFLVFIFVHFYLVQCTFSQNIVNYDAWHTCGSLPGALPLYGHPSPSLPRLRAGWWRPLVGLLVCEPLNPNPQTLTPKP